MSRSQFFFLAIPLALVVFLSSAGELHAFGLEERTGAGGDVALKIVQRDSVTKPTAVGVVPAPAGDSERVVKVNGADVQPSSNAKVIKSTPGDESSSGKSGSNNAAFTPTGPTLPEFLERITSIFDGIIPFIIGLTVFFIIWKIVVYVIHAGEEEKRTEAKHFVLWGIIAIFCMLSIWGFVNILLNSFELDTVIDPEDIPTVPLIEAPTP